MATVPKGARIETLRKIFLALTLITLPLCCIFEWRTRHLRRYLGIPDLPENLTIILIVVSLIALVGLIITSIKERYY